MNIEFKPGHRFCIVIFSSLEKHVMHFYLKKQKFYFVVFTVAAAEEAAVEKTAAAAVLAFQLRFLHLPHQLLGQVKLVLRS